MTRSITIVFSFLVCQLAAQDPLNSYVLPGKTHHWFKSLEGMWRVEITAWQNENQIFSVSEVKAEGALIAGGRFLEMKLSGKPSIGEFESTIVIGYDDYVQKIQWVQWSNASTVIWCLSGIKKENQLEVSGAVRHPLGEGDMRIRQQLTRIDADHFVIELFLEKDGKEWRAEKKAFSRQ